MSSYKVIDYSTKRRPVCDFLFDFDSNLGPIVSHSRDIKGFVYQKTTFSAPAPVRARDLGCSLEVGPQIIQLIITQVI